MELKSTEALKFIKEDKKYFNDWKRPIGITTAIHTAYYIPTVAMGFAFLPTLLITIPLSVVTQAIIKPRRGTENTEDKVKEMEDYLGIEEKPRFPYLAKKKEELKNKGKAQLEKILNKKESKEEKQINKV